MKLAFGQIESLNSWNKILLAMDGKPTENYCCSKKTVYSPFSRLSPAYIARGKLYTTRGDHAWALGGGGLLGCLPPRPKS